MSTISSRILAGDKAHQEGVLLSLCELRIHNDGRHRPTRRVTFGGKVSRPSATSGLGHIMTVLHVNDVDDSDFAGSQIGYVCADHQHVAHAS